MKSAIWIVGALSLILPIVGCGDDQGSGADGNLSVLLEAEETIVDGIRAGTGEENILDGFDVDFSRYIVSVGLVQMNQVDGGNPQASSVIAVADFTSLPTTLPELTAFDGIPTGQYTDFGFATPIATASAVNVNQVPADDVDAMVANGWSYLIEGTIARVSDGATKEFLIQADVPSIYSACAVEGLEPGVNVSRNSSVDITLHGDHIFFNGFPEEEGNVLRLAQWMWDIEDTDGDDVLTQTDFEAATDVGTLFPSPPQGVYELTGGPISPIDNAWDFIRAQLGTQGHIFGEGECEWSPL
ncbi:MAG: hypothetical protein WCE62_04880 [Polyangiales bacterium]